MDDLLAEKLELEAIEEKAYFAMLAERGITEEEYEREIEMEELSEKLFNIKQNALRELRKAQDSIREAYNCVSEYNSEIDDNSADELIDMNFLDDVSIRIQEMEKYTQWSTEEIAALKHEGYMAISDRRAA